jgi:hypothetical protein
MANYKNPNLTSSNISFVFNNDRNINKCWFLLPFTQLPIWSNKFFDKGCAPIVWSGVCNSHMQHNFLCKRCANNEFYKGCSNNNFNSEIEIASKVRKSCSKDPIMKLGSFGHNSLEYCAYLSSPWPCYHTREGNGQLSKLNIILFHICNLGSAIFAWSILSWIMQRNSSFDRTNFVFQIWYNFLHYSWCKICFFNFVSYYRASLLFFLIWISSPWKIHN